MQNFVKEHQFNGFVWIDIQHPNLKELPEIAQKYQLDYHLIKDSLEHGHLPKIEKLPDYTFIILRAYVARQKDVIPTVGDLSNKIAFFLKKNQLITVHRTEFDFLKKINSDYKSLESLLFDIIYNMIETFSPPSITQSEVIDEMEKVMFIRGHNLISLKDLYFHKSKARISKKLLLITQNVVNQIEITSEWSTTLQDIKDKVANLILIYDEVTEDAHNLLNIYLSVTTQKNNDVMKLLTIFSAFFLPLTFIVGLYGMNFKYMPEIGWKYGYLMVIILMALVSITIYIWFKRRKII